MTTRIFVPMDAAALSVGAGPVAAAVRAEIAARKLDAKLVRNGSRGLLWLEPLLEIETPEGGIGYGPVAAADGKNIFDAGAKAAPPLKLCLIEGMAIAGIAVGATKGYVYIRSEYPHAFRQMVRAIEIARVTNLLGTNVLGSNRIFDMEARLGAGAYICGEETSLLESLEGRRG